MKTSATKLRRDIRALIIFFIVGLALSGITAFPLETELRWLVAITGDHGGWMSEWLSRVYHALKYTNQVYPFIAYGADWLAFAHLVIAVAFIGPLRDPVRNIWIIQFGMIACVMIFPLAFIAGSIREIPVAWRLIDCSFGVFGLIPLTACYYKIKQLEKESGEWSMMNGEY
jgi:hypothetical protein